MAVLLMVGAGCSEALDTDPDDVMEKDMTEKDGVMMDDATMMDGGDMMKDDNKMEDMMDDDAMMKDDDKMEDDAMMKDDSMMKSTKGAYEDYSESVGNPRKAQEAMNERMNVAKKVLSKYGDKVILIDEVLTPDSSRFWDVDEYHLGADNNSFDKQFVRDYLLSINWDKNPPAPHLPPEVIVKTEEKYRQALRLLTGKDIED